MALRDTILGNIDPSKQTVRKASGQLVETSKPLNQLAGQAGLPAAPTTPGGAAAIGASPDAAKMAGTPGQLAGAVRQSLTGAGTLQQAEQDKTLRNQLSAEEQAKRADADKLQQTLGTTSERAQGLINAEVARLSTPAPAAGMDTTTLTGNLTTAQAAVDTTKAALQAAQDKFNTDSKLRQDSISAAQANINQARATFDKINTTFNRNFRPTYWNAGRDTLNAVLTANKPALTPPEIPPVPAELTTAVTQAEEAAATAANARAAPIRVAGSTVQLAPGTLKATDPTKQMEADALVAKVIGGDLTALTTLSALTGLTPAKLQETVAAEGIKQQGAQQLATAASGIMGEAGGVKALIADPSFGVDAAELGRLLGVSEDQINNMSIDQLEQAVKAVGTSTDRTDALSQSSLLGSAERASLRDVSKQASTSGTATTDAQLLDLGTALESADQVELFGVKGTLKELLADDNISSRITDILALSPEEQTKLLSKPENAGLKSFLTNYKEALNSAVSGFGSTVSTYGGIQEANKALLSFGNQTISPELAKQLLGVDVTASSTSKLNLNNSPLLKWAASQPDKGEQAITVLLANLEVADTLNKMKPEELNILFANGGKKLEEYKGVKQRYADWQALDKSNLANVLGFMYSTPVDAAAIQAQIVENGKRRRLGLPINSEYDMFDMDRDGRIDNPTVIASRLKDKMGPTQLQDFLTKSPTEYSAPKEPQKITPLTPEEVGIANYMSTMPTDYKVLLADVKGWSMLDRVKQVEVWRKAAKYTGEHQSMLKQAIAAYSDLYETAHYNSKKA